ncbi:GlsB/YeaQ/YmgE family stress response membrane protein [Gordonia sp. NPDC003376]
MILIGIIVFGILVGVLAQLIMGRKRASLDWGLACATGLAGAFLGGVFASVVTGHGMGWSWPGLIGAVAGSVILTALWQWYQQTSEQE